jgi:hypothetical protein
MIGSAARSSHSYPHCGCLLIVGGGITDAYVAPSAKHDDGSVHLCVLGALLDRIVFMRQMARRYSSVCLA